MARRIDDLSRAVRSLADESRGRRDPTWQRVPLPATVSGRYLALGIVGLYLGPDAGGDSAVAGIANATRAL